MPGTAPTRTLSAALSWIKAKIGATTIGGEPVRRACLAIVRQTWGLQPTGITTAYAGWKLTRRRHERDYNAPPGAPCWFQGPTPAGHVATSVGNGYVVGNDYPTSGVVKKARIKDIEKGWGCRYLGWTEDYPRANGDNVRLPLDLVGEKPEGGTLKVGVRVVVSTPVGLRARLKPGTGRGTDSGRTVAKGYRIKLTQIQHADGYLWGRGTKYWYALETDSGARYVRIV